MPRRLDNLLLHLASGVLCQAAKSRLSFLDTISCDVISFDLPSDTRTSKHTAVPRLTSLDRSPRLTSPRLTSPHLNSTKLQAG